MVTKRFVHLLTAEGLPVWKVPYEPPSAAYHFLHIYCLKPAGQFMLWMVPDPEENPRAGWKLPIQVSWLARDQGVVKTVEVASLPQYHSEPTADEKPVRSAAPLALVTAVHLLWGVACCRICRRGCYPSVGQSRS